MNESVRQSTPLPPPPARTKMENKKEDFTHCSRLSNRSLCRRNFERYWVNVTDLGSVSGASYVIADPYIFAIFFAGSLLFVLFFWANSDHVRCEFTSFQLVYLWNSTNQIVKPGTSERTHGRIGRTNWWRKCIQSSTNFEAFWRFPALSYILIATAKENGNVEYQWCNLRPRLNSGLLHFPSVTLEISPTQWSIRQAVGGNFLILFWGWSVEGFVGVVRGPGQ